MSLQIATPTPRNQLPRFQPTLPDETRPSLPSIGLSISRPSSRVSTTSTRSLSSSHYSQATQASQNVQLPALSALANLASLSQTPPPEGGFRAVNGNNGYVKITLSLETLKDDVYPGQLEVCFEGGLAVLLVSVASPKLLSEHDQKDIIRPARIFPALGN
ncbi:hypothetical protein EJ08DRAFT_634071 [Tothia fuscella]|uniref:Uncharacterized protein n=1 Tax=Tothia fuscella TaxID=1048955 RepID=A0A9P4TY44_9PEZI|nr:hypothetical protein EJ08DRAFT_634071 [Tothia fuscella]